MQSVNVPPTSIQNCHRESVMKASRAYSDLAPMEIKCE